MTPRASTALCATAALLAACTEGAVESDYQLQLEPRLLANQDVFGDSPAVSVVVRDPHLGTHSVHTLGELGSGSIQGDEFGPLDEAMVGVLLQGAGAAADAFDPDTLVAYGEVGPITLGAEGTQETHQVLLPAFGGIGDLRELDYPAVGAGVAMLPSGDVAIVGGGRSSGVEKGTAAIRRLADLDAGDWMFEEVGELDTTLVWTTATVVQGEDGADYVFVAGGVEDFNDFYGSYDWWMLDAATLEVAWSGDSMKVMRSQHRAEVLPDGRVLLVGGVDNDENFLPHDAAFETFDPATRTFQLGADLTGLPAMGFASASLGADGVLLCGGGNWYGAETGRMEPVDTCVVVDTQGGWREVASLPAPRNYLAMAPVAGGRVLAAGGLGEVFSQGDEVDATSTAWLYDPVEDAWDTASPLGEARAYHAVVPTSDGRAVVVGGASSGGQPSRADTGPPVTCPEIFDPASKSFSPSEYCGPAGSGAMPAVAWHPAHGAFAAAGLGEAGEVQETTGIIGLPPDIAEDR